MLMLLIAAGLFPADPAPPHSVAPDPERHIPDAQFVQYLEYRARLESGIDCQ
jgi:hypothetical protein